MDAKDQIDHLENDLEIIIERYRKEYDLSYAAIVGVFMLKVHQLSVEAYDEPDQQSQS